MDILKNRKEKVKKIANSLLSITERIYWFDDRVLVVLGRYKGQPVSLFFYFFDGIDSDEVYLCFTFDRYSKQETIKGVFESYDYFRLNLEDKLYYENLYDMSVILVESMDMQVYSKSACGGKKLNKPVRTDEKKIAEFRLCRANSEMFDLPDGS